MDCKGRVLNKNVYKTLRVQNYESVAYTLSIECTYNIILNKIIKWRKKTYIKTFNTRYRIKYQ